MLPQSMTRVLTCVKRRYIAGTVIETRCYRCPVMGVVQEKWLGNERLVTRIRGPLNLTALKVYAGNIAVAPRSLRRFDRGKQLFNAAPAINEGSPPKVLGNSTRRRYYESGSLRGLDRLLTVVQPPRSKRAS